MSIGAPSPWLLLEKSRYYKIKLFEILALHYSIEINYSIIYSNILPYSFFTSLIN